MKELTIEQKAQRYNEALQRTRKWYDVNTNEGYRSIFEDIFPELAESKDERIELLNYLYDVHDDDEERARWIAWLEKQGEQKSIKEHNACEFCEDRYGCVSPCSMKLVEEEKPADKVEPKFKVGDEIKTKNEESLIITRIDRWGYWSEDLFICNFDDADKWKLVEQKPDDKSEIKPKFKAGDRVIGVVSGTPYFITKICDGYYNTESGCIIMFCAQDNFELYEQNPAWSKENKNNILFLTSIIEECFKDKEKITLCGDNVCANFTKKDVIDRLKSLKDRIQPKQEWSEEDMKMIKEIIFLLKHHNSNETLTTVHSIEDMINWLKSLRPQNTWKPSEEQIKAVKEAACYSSVFSEKTIDNLISLSKQLKKLMEE